MSAPNMTEADVGGFLLQAECANFLYREARLLDAVQLREWLTLLSDDISYSVPVRQSVEMQVGDGFSSRAFFLTEDLGSLKLRVEKLTSEFSWAENPRTRTRRMVSNVEVLSAAPSADGQAIELSSNLALFCHRGDEPAPVVLTAQRKDRLKRIGGELKLSKREALLECTVLGLEAFSIFV